MHRRKKNHRKGKSSKLSKEGYEQARDELLNLAAGDGPFEEGVIDARRFTIDQVSYVIAVRIDFSVIFWVESGTIQGDPVLDDWHHAEYRAPDPVFGLLRYTKNPIRVIRQAVSELADLVCSNRHRLPYFFFSANGEQRRRVYWKLCGRIETTTGYGAMLAEPQGSKLYFLRDSPRRNRPEESEEIGSEERNLEILRAGDTGRFCTPSHYPISKVVSRAARRFGESPDRCVASLGIRNRRRSAKRINRWIAEGEGHLRLLREFGEASGEWPFFEEALEQTKELRKTEREAAMWLRASEAADRFRPGLFVVPEATAPRTIFIEAFTEGRARVVPWESYPDESVSEARVRAGLVVAEHYREHGGECWNWGAIAKYCFAEAWNRHCIISVDGELLEVVEEPWVKPEATLSLKGRGGIEKLFR